MRNRVIECGVITSALLLSSCIFALQGGSAWRKPGFQIPTGAAIVLSDIADGSGGDGTMPGSGGLISTKLTQQLMARGLQVMAGGSSDKAQLLREASERRIPYVLVARITRWEDNATEWSSKRDSAGVSMELYDSATGEVVVSGDRSTQGVYQPDRCADVLARNLVKQLFGERVPQENPQC